MSIKSFFYTIILALFASSSLFAQDELNVFPMVLEGESVLATQDIDERYLGTYLKDKGSKQFQYNLQNNDASYYLAQQDGAWAPDNKNNIRWGVLVKNEVVSYVDLTEFNGDEMMTYEAMILIVHNQDTDKYTYMNLYEKNGNIYLDHAKKIDEFANKD